MSGEIYIVNECASCPSRGKQDAKGLRFIQTPLQTSFRYTAKRHVHLKRRSLDSSIHDDDNESPSLSHATPLGMTMWW